MSDSTNEQGKAKAFRDPVWPEGLYRLADDTYLWQRTLDGVVSAKKIGRANLVEAIGEAERLNRRMESGGGFSLPVPEFIKKLNRKVLIAAAAGLAVLALTVIAVAILLSTKEPPEQVTPARAENPGAPCTATAAEEEARVEVSASGGEAVFAAEAAGGKESTPEAGQLQQPFGALETLKAEKVRTDEGAENEEAPKVEDSVETGAKQVDAAPAPEAVIPAAVETETAEKHDELLSALLEEHPVKAAVVREDTEISAENPGGDPTGIPLISSPLDDPCMDLKHVKANLGAVSMSVERLQLLKAATVFIKVTSAGIESSGSGFLIYKSGTSGWIATNKHVIATLKDRHRNISIVFYSGRKDELIIDRIPQIIVSHESDLALLQIKHENLPEPVGFTTDMKLLETLPVKIFGFPFGKALSLSEGNPTITISQGAVSSIRLNDMGRVAGLQIDGGVNPGNSGGPVVDVTGNLLGISVAKGNNTGIGLALPAAMLRVMLRGKAVSIEKTFVNATRRRSTFRFKVHLSNPLGRITSAHLLIGRAGTAEESKPLPEIDPGTNTIRRIEDDAGRIDLEIKDNQVAEGDFRFDRKRGDSETTWFVFQVHYQLDTGQHFFTVPEKLKVKFSPDAYLEFEHTSEIMREFKIVRSGVLKIDKYVSRKVECDRAYTGVRSAGGQKYLLLELAGGGLIHVYDIEHEKMISAIDLPSPDSVYAAGATRFYASDPEEHKISRYNIRTGKMETSFDSPVSGNIVAMTQGEITDNPLIIAYVSEEGTTTSLRACFFDTRKLKVISEGDLTGNAQADALRSGYPPLYSSWDGQIHIYSMTGAPPCMGFYIEKGSLYRNTLDQFKSFTFPGKMGLPVPGLRPAFFYTPTGIYDADMQMVNYPGDGKGVAIPVPGDKYYVWANAKGIGIYYRRDLFPIFQLPVIPINDFSGPSDGLLPYQRIYFSPKKKKFTILPEGNKEILIVELDYKDYEKKHKSVFLEPVNLPSCRRGGVFRYSLPVKVEAGPVEYELLEAPINMRISRAGSITWSIPKGYPPGPRPFVVSFTDKDSKQVTLYMNIEVK